MQALVWIAIGILAGWLAGMLMKGRDYGLSGNLILGLFGSLVGGWLMQLLGFDQPNQLWQQAIVSLLGAMLVLALARRLKPAARQTKRALGAVGGIADLEGHIRKLGEYEQRALERFRAHGPSILNPNEAFEDQLTFGQRIADKVAKFGGSWTFIGLFLLFMLIWMIMNTVAKKHFDPFPFILLNLILSCLAAMQAPVIMMSQNRQSVKDRLMASNDYDVNCRSEMELVKLHARFDELRERDWQELVQMQRKQISLLEDVVRSMREGRGGGEAAGEGMPHA